EYAYFPANQAEIPQIEFLYQFTSPSPRRVLHSHGAIRCLGELLELVSDDGFILINDYASAEQEADAHYEHQRFSLSTAIGLNFRLLKAYFGDAGRCQWVQPSEERENMHSCLLGPKLNPETVNCFLERFNKTAFDELDAPVQFARQCAKMGRLDMSLGNYRA